MMKRREPRAQLRVMALEDRTVPAGLVAEQWTEDYLNHAIEQAVNNLSDVPLTQLSWLDQTLQIPPQAQFLADKYLDPEALQPPTNALNDRFIGAATFAVQQLGFDPSTVTFGDLTADSMTPTGRAIAYAQTRAEGELANNPFLDLTPAAGERFIAQALLNDDYFKQHFEGMKSFPMMDGMMLPPHMMPFANLSELAALANGTQRNEANAFTVATNQLPLTNFRATTAEPVTADALTNFLTSTTTGSSLFGSGSSSTDEPVELSLQVGLATLTNRGLPAATDLLADRDPRSELRPTTDSAFGMIALLSSETALPRTNAPAAMPATYAPVASTPLHDYLQGTASVRLAEPLGPQVAIEAPSGWLPHTAPVTEVVALPADLPIVVTTAPTVVTEKPVDAVEASGAGTLAVLVGVGMMQALHQPQRKRQPGEMPPANRE